MAEAVCPACLAPEGTKHSKWCPQWELSVLASPPSFPQIGEPPTPHGRSAWTEIPVSPDDDTPHPDCVGWDEHRWTLSIEEGKPSLSTEPCGSGCTPDQLGDLMEFLVLAGDLPVTVRLATDCPAYPVDEWCRPTGPKTLLPGYEMGSHYIAHGTSCDCNWWPVVEVVRDGA